MGNSTSNTISFFAIQATAHLFGAAAGAFINKFVSLSGPQRKQLHNTLTNLAIAFWRGRSIYSSLKGILLLISPSRGVGMMLYSEILKILASCGINVPTNRHNETSEEKKSGQEIEESKLPVPDEAQIETLKTTLIKQYRIDPEILARVPPYYLNALLNALSEEDPLCCITLDSILDSEKHVVRDVVVIFQHTEAADGSAIVHAYLFKGTALMEWFSQSDSEERINPLNRAPVDRIYYIS